MLGYTLCEAFKLPKEPRERMFAILFLIALNPLFWGLFEQAGGSLNLYTDTFRRPAGRADQPVPVDQPDLHRPARADLRHAVAVARPARGWSPRPRPSSASRCVQVGLGFLVFVWGARAVGHDVLTPVIFVFLIYLLHTTGELCLSPVGLSAMTRLAPAAPRQLHHGRVVLHDRGGQLRRRQDRRGDRRRERRDVARS